MEFSEDLDKPIIINNENITDFIDPTPESDVLLPYVIITNRDDNLLFEFHDSFALVKTKTAV